LIAGDPFSLTATSSGVGSNPGGYTGVPKINSASVQAVSPATVTGTLAGNFSAATSGAGSSTATGAAFTYSEVGIFRLRGPDFTVPRIPGIYDDIWTAIDSDPSKNDCNSGTSAAAYSNTKDASGKYGCNFGITADTTSFGRFTPAYFDVILTPGCGAGGFTYSGQPFQVTATAYNTAGATTQNYDSGGGSGFAKDVTISAPGNPNYFNVGPPAGNVIAGASRFSLGNGSTYPVTNSLTGPTPPITYTFPVKETAPLTPSVSPAPPATPLRATDTDGVSSLNHVEPQIDIRSGRVHLYNAYGSELLDLPMATHVEYYSGTADGWLIHSADTCSGVSLSAFSNYQGNLNAGETCVQDTGNPGVSGQGCSTAGPLVPVNERYYALPSSGGYNLYLKNPGAGNEGSVDVTADLSTKPWLRFDWDGDPLTADQDPTGKATFGLYRGSPRNIYLRERY